LASEKIVNPGVLHQICEVLKATEPAAARNQRLFLPPKNAANSCNKKG